jgi:hypothetical protein
MTDTPIANKAQDIVDALDRLTGIIRRAEIDLESLKGWIEASEKGYNMTGIESWKDMIEEYTNQRIETLAKLEKAKKEWNETLKTLS